MELVADLLLGGGALAAAVYCLVLSRKLSKLKGLDQDLGGAIAILSQQVDEMNRALVSAQESTSTSSQTLAEKTEAARNTADRLELLLTALHDLPDPEALSDLEFERHKEAAPEPQNLQPNVFVRNRTNRAVQA